MNVVINVDDVKLLQMKSVIIKKGEFSLYIKFKIYGGFLQFCFDL